jgi:hypothetical protein
MAKKNKYDIKVKTDLSFEEAMRVIVNTPKSAVNKAVKATSKKNKPKTSN